MTLSTKVRRRRNGTDPDIDFESGAVDKGIVKPKCPRNVTAAKKFH